jgi:hypothetical protein
LEYINIAEVRITGTKWREIKTAIIRSFYRANAEKKGIQKSATQTA